MSLLSDSVVHWGTVGRDGELSINGFQGFDHCISIFKGSKLSYFMKNAIKHDFFSKMTSIKILRTDLEQDQGHELCLGCGYGVLTLVVFHCKNQGK